MLDKKETSLVNQVFSIIENNILTGKYPQGAVIDATTLASEMSVGVATINTVIPMLKGEMLIEEADDGYVVLGISTKDIEEMFNVKRAIEAEAFAMAAENLTEKALDDLQAVIDEQLASLEENRGDVLGNLDTKFHDIIFSGCGSLIYKTILSPLHHKLGKCRKDSLEAPGRSRKSIDEHLAIYAALKARDKEGVRELAIRHIEKAYKSIMEAEERI